MFPSTVGMSKPETFSLLEQIWHFSEHFSLVYDDVSKYPIQLYSTWTVLRNSTKLAHNRSNLKGNVRRSQNSLI